MNYRPPERDWKTFRKLREKTLDRLCHQILKELEGTCRDQSQSHHERFLRAWDQINRGNEKIANAFDNPARSNMVLDLAIMEKMGLLEDGELGSFTEETREKVEVLARGPQ